MAEEGIDDPAIVQLAELTISQALRDRATAIHLERDSNQSRVRYRIDGLLHCVMEPPHRIFPTVLACLKRMAGMDVAETRVPQDGLITLTHEQRSYELRASTLPGLHGEKLVLKIQAVDAQALESYDLARLGFSSCNLRRLHSLLNRPYGFCVVGGGNRSGKTTFFYSCLRQLHQESRSLMAVEEEVTLQLPWVHQILTNHRVGLTTTAALRSGRRQDTDVIMVGNLLDNESLRYCLEAALSHRLVLAGCYCSEAAESLRHLLDRHVEPYLLASGLIGSVALRMARRLCPHCREPFEPSAASLAALGCPKGPLYQAGGCEHCSGRGHLGVCCLQEVLLPSEAQREILLRRGSLEELRRALPEDFETLRQDGLAKLQQGLLSPEEFVRVLQDYPLPE